MKKEFNKFQEVTSIITALNSETKMRIVYAIKHLSKEVNVNTLVEITGIERTNISKQLKDLEIVGVLSSKQIGREKFFNFDKTLAEEKKNMIDSILTAYEKCDCSKGKLPEKLGCC